MRPVLILNVLSVLFVPSRCEIDPAVILQGADDTQDSAFLDRFLSPNCSATQFDCGEKCIDSKYFHDCVQHCDGGQDEMCWPGMIKCDACRCVAPLDAEALCMDRSFFNTKLCGTSTTNRAIHTCQNGNCILLKWTLDGRNDCGDFSDEDPCRLDFHFCPVNTTTCEFTPPTTISCKCIEANTVFSNGFCIPISLDPDGVVSTTTGVPTTQGPTPEPPVKCGLLSAPPATPATDPISLIYAIDAGTRMGGDLTYLAQATAAHVFPVVQQYPDHIGRFVLVPFREGVRAPVDTPSPLLFYQALQQTPTSSGVLCSKPALSAVHRGLLYADRRSVLFLFTDGGATDTALFDSVMRVALEKEAQINVVLTDDVCMCICGGASPKMAESYTTYKRITALTHGSFLETRKTAADYNTVMQMGAYQLHPSAVMLARSTTTFSMVQFPIDSGLDAVALCASGENVVIEASSQSSRLRENILLTGPNAQLVVVEPVYPGDRLTVGAHSNEFAMLRISALGWPDFTFAFTPAPFADPALLTFTDKPWFGLPEYAAFGFTDLATTGYNVSMVTVFETLTGSILFRGAPTAYTLDPNYQFVVGPLPQTCEYFDILVHGLNDCNEPFNRLSRSSFRALQANYRNRLPGNCGANQFDCGGGVCIAAAKYRDNTADCPDGIDEGRPMDQYHCQGGCASSAPPGHWCLKPGVFRCGNGYCVPQSWRNDGANDCGDFSDEDGSPVPTPSTTDDPLDTPPVYTPPLQHPPVFIDVYDRIFFNNCTRGRRDDFFECSDGSCIPLKNFRDCEINCPDGSDEVCNVGLEKCASCRCGLPNERNISCIDRDLDAICERAEMFPCESGGFCVPIARILDGRKDCPDMSDEDPSYLDECYLGKHHCDKKAVCTNLVGGSYACTCPFGYNGNGTVCILPHS